MRVSIILLCYKMTDQIGNTLRSLVPPYQKNLSSSEIEILLVDNGSPTPIGKIPWSSGSNITYSYIPPSKARPSPAEAMNQAVFRASSKTLCLMIDGARMITPGTLYWGLRLLESMRNSVVEVRGWHLGPGWQPESIGQGYNREVERELLEETRWWENGYRLFDIAAPTPQVKAGLSVPAAESNCLFIERELFEQIGGFDERYKEAGGGFVNLDFYARTVTSAEQVWTILGEGTFHQVHGGAATGLPTSELQEALIRWRKESEGIRGPMPRIDPAKFVLAGHMPQELMRWLCRNLQETPGDAG